jgi:transglutaminase-like putative cysteine protease
MRWLIPLVTPIRAPWATFERVISGVLDAVLTSVGCRFVFDLPAPTHAVVLVEPHSSEIERIVTAQLMCVPDVQSHAFVDGFENRCRRLSMPAGELAIEYTASVEVSDEPDRVDESAQQLAPSELPSHALPFLLPSRYCESDLLAEQAWDLFGDTAPGWSRVQAIVDWVHDEIEFDYGRSSTSHTAMSVLKGKIGVCRDYTHAAISLCRALNCQLAMCSGICPTSMSQTQGCRWTFAHGWRCWSTDTGTRLTCATINAARAES